MIKMNLLKHTFSFVSQWASGLPHRPNTCSVFPSSLVSQSYIMRTAMFVCQYLLGEVLFDASNQKQGCEVQIGGLHFKHLVDHRAAAGLCSRSAMIPFDTAEKKVTGGAWFDISLNDLRAGFSKHHKDAFRSCCRLQG